MPMMTANTTSQHQILSGIRQEITLTPGMKNQYRPEPIDLDYCNTRRELSVEADEFDGEREQEQYEEEENGEIDELLVTPKADQRTKFHSPNLNIGKAYGIYITPQSKSMFRSAPSFVPPSARKLNYKSVVGQYVKSPKQSFE